MSIALLWSFIPASNEPGGAASGRYSENFVVIELLINYSYSQSKASLTYYRDANAKN
jgi:hypothetical protein